MPPLTAEHLAELAIESARRERGDRDGISYLMMMKQNGIATPLSEPYEQEILRRTETHNLRGLEAGLNLRGEALKQRGTIVEAVMCEPSCHATQCRKFVCQRFAEDAAQAARQAPTFWPRVLDLLKLREHFGHRVAHPFGRAPADRKSGCNLVK